MLRAPSPKQWKPGFFVPFKVPQLKVLWRYGDVSGMLKSNVTFGFACGPKGGHTFYVCTGYVGKWESRLTNGIRSPRQ